ncbi:hypothetical protein Tco_0827244 [Tanacetum coccineum]
MDTKLLSAPESNNTLARCWFRRNVPAWQVTNTGCKLLLVAGPLFLQFLGDNISPDSFLPSILLLVVIIVAVVIVVVAVILVVIVVEGSSIIKLSFVIIGSLHRIVLCNPPMKTSMSFSEFGTIVGHKTANSWNLLT